MDDRVAFEEKVGSALDALHTGARLLTRDPGRAEALVVGAVTEAFRSRSPGEESGFKTWIVGRMVRRYIEHAGEDTAVSDDRLRDSALDEDAGEAAPEEMSPELEALVNRLESLEARDPDGLGRLIRSTLERLALLERAAVWLVTVIGFTYAEAGSALNVGVADVRALVLRGRRHLQRQLALELRESRSNDASAPGWLGGSTRRPGRP
ncbi:MAG: RNA polymerase sigma factor [Gemmatimonadota bacterium]